MIKGLHTVGVGCAQLLDSLTRCNLDVGPAMSKSRLNARWRKPLSDAGLLMLAMLALSACDEQSWLLRPSSSYDQVAHTPPPGGGSFIDASGHVEDAKPSEPFYVNSEGYIREIEPGQVAPLGAPLCSSSSLSDLQPGTPCYAAAAQEQADQDQLAQQARVRAQKFIGTPFLVAYGSMLCGSADDALRMRDDLSYGSCKASHGGWGRVAGIDGPSGTFYMRLLNGEEGWDANPDTDLASCRAYIAEQRSSPDPVAPSALCAGER